MARSVADAAAILSIIAGRDPRDNFTLAQPARVPDYTLALKHDALKGARLGVPRQLFARTNAVMVAAFNASLDTFRAFGATIVDPADLPDTAELRASGNESIVTQADFKVSMCHPDGGLRLRCPRVDEVSVRSKWQATWRSSSRYQPAYGRSRI